MELKLERVKVVQLNMELEKINKIPKPMQIMPQINTSTSKKFTRKIIPNWKPPKKISNLNVIFLFPSKFLNNHLL